MESASFTLGIDVLLVRTMALILHLKSVDNLRSTCNRKAKVTFRGKYKNHASIFHRKKERKITKLFGITLHLEACHCPLSLIIVVLANAVTIVAVLIIVLALHCDDSTCHPKLHFLLLFSLHLSLFLFLYP